MSGQHLVCQKCGHNKIHQHDEQGNCLYKPKAGYPKK